MSYARAARAELLGSRYVSPMKPWQRYLRAVAIAYGVVLVGAALGQRALLYPRPTPQAFPSRGTVSRVSYADGEVPLWVELAPDPAAPLLAWFHGNAEQAGGEGWYMGASLQRGVSFAAAEYPGYGLSSGAGPSEGALVAAARSTIAALPAPTGPLVCVGESLGTGVAATMAAEGLCAKLVLVSPYTSLPRVAQHAVPWLPGRLLVLDRFDTLSRAAKISVPTLILHGDRDEVVPVEMGRELAAAFPAARLVERPGRGHNDMVDDELFDQVAAFARE